MHMSGGGGLLYYQAIIFVLRRPPILLISLKLMSMNSESVFMNILRDFCCCCCDFISCELQRCGHWLTLFQSPETLAYGTAYHVMLSHLKIDKHLHVVLVACQTIVMLLLVGQTQLQRSKQQG